MFALVDCNNFYPSCEKLFNPKLNGRPVVVLSNNDGCVIARSKEAKDVGIVMGSPAFMMKEVIQKYNVAVFSSNYTLYGDLSDRVMQTLASFVPCIEIYSIDEAFLYLEDLVYMDLLKLGVEIKEAVKQNIGIPVSVGIAPTKTLAKMANRFAKKMRKDVGVHWAANNEMIEEMLAFTEIGDVWGIGHQYSLYLKKNGFKTALDFVKAPDEWVRKNMTVVGQRMLNELRGIRAIMSLSAPMPKKNICTSRSFGKLLTDKSEISIAVSNYAAQCAKKLRQQKSCCKKVHVFVQTNPHKTEERQ
jgi:DNA polymerase V